MADSLTLIVLVATGGSPSATEAMLQAAHESLGSETRIEVRETPREPTDTEALSTEHVEHADAVAELAYKDRKHRQVILRVHVAKPRRWLERTLLFDPSDVEVERSRALGYAMAAILPEPFPHHPIEASKPEPPPPPPPAPPTPPIPAAPPPPPPKEPPAAVAPASSAHAYRESVELFFIAGTGLSGPADAAGGELGLQFYILPPISVRVGGGAESGSLGSVDVQTLTEFGSLGAVFHPFRPTPTLPLAVSVRADYLLLNATGIHTPNQSKNVTLSGVRSMAELGWAFVQPTEAVAGVGIEGLFPPIHVVQGGQTSVLVPPFRFVGEVGLRASF